MGYRKLIGLILIGLVTAASAEEPRTNVGVLTCTLAKSAEAQAPNMTCGFKPTGSGAEEKYVGSVRQGDQDVVAGKLVLVWAVIGPAGRKMPAGFLEQRYVRAKSVAGQSPVLVGETNPSVVLQLETNTVAETYGDITQIKLELAATPA